MKTLLLVAIGKIVVIHIFSILGGLTKQYDTTLYRLTVLQCLPGLGGRQYFSSKPIPYLCESDTCLLNQTRTP